MGISAFMGVNSKPTVRTGGFYVARGMGGGGEKFFYCF